MDTLSRREVGAKTTPFVLHTSLHTLNQDEALMKEVKAEALKRCDPAVKGVLHSRSDFTFSTDPRRIGKGFAQCAEGRTVSVAWACRKQWAAIQDCMRLESVLDLFITE